MASKKDIPKLMKKRKQLWNNMLRDPKLRTKKNIKQAKSLTDLIIRLK